MASTQYIVPIFLNKKEEDRFRQVVTHYNQRNEYTTHFHVEIVGRVDQPAAIPGAAREEYVELRLSCTDALALFRFGEFWGNKTMQGWAQELKADLKPRKGGQGSG